MRRTEMTEGFADAGDRRRSRRSRLTRRLASVAAISLLAALTQVSGSEAALAPTAGTLAKAQDQLTFQGSISSDNAGILGGSAPDVFTVDIQLPPHTWLKPGGVQIGIHWEYGVEDPWNDLDLTVYGPDGEEVARSAGGDEDTELVLLPKPVNGLYRVEVYPYSADNLTYWGLVEVEYAPKVMPVRDLLPNLTPLPQRKVLFAACNEDEIIEQGARRCLRFEQIIANFGDGQFGIEYDFSGIATTKPLYQRVYRSDGTSWTRLAETYEFHPFHAHFHYQNFALSHLWASDAAGSKLGTAPARSGRKNGFCLIDVEDRWFGMKGDAAKNTETDCLTNNAQGISVGWADVYNWYLSGQYIEASGLPDGYYLLETIADPASPTTPIGSALETDETDNSVFLHIRTCGDVVDMVGQTTNCGV